MITTSASSVRRRPAFGMTVSVGRSTTPGRTCPAVSVGRKPKTVVTTTPTSKPVIAGCAAITNGRLVASSRSAAPRIRKTAPQPRTIPNRLPMMPIRTASTRNRIVICPACKPSVLSTATSTVRRRTITCMVLMMPMLPISSESSPMTVTNWLILSESAV